MPRQRRPTNLKHGAYARRAVLPGESIAEFEVLRARLIAHFEPDGVIETELVESLARCLWRKQRRSHPMHQAAVEVLEEEDKLWSEIDQELQRLARHRGLEHTLDVPREEIDRVVAEAEDLASRNHGDQIREIFSGPRSRTTH